MRMLRWICGEAKARQDKEWKNKGGTEMGGGRNRDESSSGEEAELVSTSI